MTLAQFVKTTYTGERYQCRQRIYCIDGFNMSVQGSSGAYCYPRETSSWYDKMEIGFPSAVEPLIMRYAESPEDPLGTVYGYVPVDIIQRVIDNHGGIDIDKTFEVKK